MAYNLGKAFEDKFKKDWKRTFPDSVIFRLRDQISKFKESSKNPCDFICYTAGKIFFTEVKSKKKNTLPWSDIRQLKLLKEYVGYTGVYPIVVGWFIDHDTVFVINVKDIIQMQRDGLKSINIRHVKNGDYNIVTVPTEKLQVYVRADYTCLLDL